MRTTLGRRSRAGADGLSVYTNLSQLREFQAHIVVAPATVRCADTRTAWRGWAAGDAAG